MQNSKSLILGISAGHGDSSAVIVKDGKIIAGVEEERFNRIKHYAGFPSASIDYCLKKAEASVGDVDLIAIAKDPSPNKLATAKFMLQHPAFLLGKVVNFSKTKNSLTADLSAKGFSKDKIRYFEHHLAHAASVRDTAPENNVAILTFDGLGDFVSTMFAFAHGNDFEILGKQYFPHSLGYYYTAMTQYLGFPFYGDEFKVMGLSSLGQPSYLKEMRKLVEATNDSFRLNHRYFPLSKLTNAFYLKNQQPYVRPIFAEAELRNLLGFGPRLADEPLEQKHHDLAKSIQVRFEEVATHLLKILHDKTRCTSLALAGGCAHNSVWVGKITEQTPFKKIYTAPACHDAGIALGAARLAYGQKIEPASNHWGLLGPDRNDAPDFDYAAHAGFENEFASEKELIAFLVKELRQGKILGLFHGNLEFGPRALGSRSIIVDPSFADMKDKLNARVKHREAFRPFAASVLYEEQEKWFENQFYAPHMEAVFTVKEPMRDKIPAVVHVDNSCRIQSVEKDRQPFYYSLIEGFFKESGIPMLLNTSFNDSEPIVCTPEDAYKCFRGCDMDYLVIGQALYSKDKLNLKQAS